MFELDRQRVLAIARVAVNRRKNEEGEGYVVYSDYNDYLSELICERKIDPITGWRLFDIKRILLDKSNDPKDRYRYEKVVKKAHFYPIER